MPDMNNVVSMSVGVAVVAMAASMTVIVSTQQTAVTPRNDSPAAAPAPAPAPPLGRTYVGSAACRRCHAPIYERWSKTRMANVVVDPREHPEVIQPDFTKADPLLTFKRDDVVFVYGSKWKQR